MEANKRILITPLDWGLGHATRCIPIIRKCLEAGAEVIIASSGEPLALLRREFPRLKSYHIPSYQVSYPFDSMVLNLSLQFPVITAAMIREYFSVRRIVRKERIDTIISDNRFGCFSPRCRNYFISHQLNIIVPTQRLDRLINGINHFIICRFYQECWIPDMPPPLNLSGRLSTPIDGIPIRYLGILSRMRPVRHEGPFDYDAIAVLSGPEPQRTRLEKELIRQLGNLEGKFMVVRGKPKLEEPTTEKAHLTVETFLTSEALEAAISRSALVISRSGYSTILDLAKLGKQAIVIPTPGQTEQEYLADELDRKGIFVAMRQHEVDVKEGMQRVAETTGLSHPDYLRTDLLDGALDALLTS